MKKRILISNIMAIIVIIVSKPESFKLFFLGLLLIISGEFIRIISSACIRKNLVLLVKGPYALCRNPLYFGTFLIILGILIQIISSDIVNTIILWVIVLSIISYVYYIAIKSEEKFLSEKFGDDFLDYMKKVPCIIPKISCVGELFKPENYNYNTFLKNKEYRGILGVIMIEILILIKIFFHI